MDIPKGVNRRGFLKSGTLAAGALVAHSAAAYAPFSILDNSNISGAIAYAQTRQRLLTGWEYRQGSLGGVWDVWRNDESETILWQAVQVPHCFNALDAVDADHPYYEGPGWYRTKLKMKNPYVQGRTLLHFEGAGQKSTVFLYLEQVGQHIGGYDEFVVDISEAASKHPNFHGELPIAVMCDNSRDLDTIPSDLNDFPRYGGLYRYVNLIYVPAISLERVHIEVAMQSPREASISVKARLYNPSALKESLQIQISIADSRGSVVQESSRRLNAWKGEQELAAFTLNSPELWSPMNPVLYRCEVSLTSVYGSTQQVEYFGCRYFEFADYGPFKLNGERLLLKGTHREEDHALTGAAMPEELTAQEMNLIKNLGANFIRLGHHQQSRSVLHLCDQLGLLVWEEIPWSRGGLGDEGYKKEAKDMLRAMIDQHYNHPSIIVWGLGNELDWPGDFPEFDKGQISAFASELNNLAHSLDPSRKTAIRRCDFCSEIPDVYSPSIWAGWYRGRYTQYKETCEREMKKVNHFIQMEWGGESHAGRHSEEADQFLLKALKGEFKNEPEHDYLLSCGQNDAFQKGDWSETYVCNLFDWHLKEQETMPWMTGSAQWIFKDFATPLRAGNPIPHVNEKGLAGRDLTLKEGYFVFQSYWAETPMIHIYGHSWPVRWGDEQEEKLVKVYSNCERVELFLHGISCGVKNRASQDFPAAGLHWILKFRNGENQLQAVGYKNGARIVDQIAFQYQTQRWQQPARLEVEEVLQVGQTVTVATRIVDANNVLCLDARNRLRFALIGEGTLLDNMGTVTGSRVLEVSNGRARVSVNINGGKSVLSVSSQALPTIFFTVA
jgi:beta-galactosidase